MVFLCKEKNVDVNLMVEIFIFIFFSSIKDDYIWSFYILKI